LDDPVLTRLPLVGAVDQLLDITDVLANTALTSRMRYYYNALIAEAPRWTRSGGQLRGVNAPASAWVASVVVPVADPLAKTHRCRGRQTKRAAQSRVGNWVRL
jgi:hypothetical protein